MILFSIDKTDSLTALQTDAVKGIIFGVTGYETVDEAVFPEMVHDWLGIEELLTPLAAELVS